MKIRVFHNNNPRDGMVFGYRAVDDDGKPNTVTEVCRYTTVHTLDDVALEKCVHQVQHRR